MTAKQQAMEDIKNDLLEHGKCFIAFKSELNPIMRKLVSEQLKAQKKVHAPKKVQHVAHCFFVKATGEAVLSMKG